MGLHRKRTQPYVRTRLGLQDTQRVDEIQGNQNFSPGATAGQTEARGTSILHKVHVLTNGVGGGHSGVVGPKPKTRDCGFRAGDSHTGG